MFTHHGEDHPRRDDFGRQAPHVEPAQPDRVDDEEVALCALNRVAACVDHFCL